MKECEYCSKESRHGGKCQGRWEDKPCLLFEKDPRGRWERREVTLSIELGTDLPEIGKDLEVELAGVEKTIRIYEILRVEWQRGGKNKGLMGIKLRVKMGYWSDQNGTIITEKPKRPQLKLVK